MTGDLLKSKNISNVKTVDVRCLYGLNTQRVKCYTGRRWLEFLNVA